MAQPVVLEGAASRFVQRREQPHAFDVTFALTFGLFNIVRRRRNRGMLYNSLLPGISTLL